MMAFHIYPSNLTYMLMFPLNLLIIPLSCLSSLDILIRLTPTTNTVSLIYNCKSTGLLIVVGCGYL